MASTFWGQFLPIRASIFSVVTTVVTAAVDYTEQDPCKTRLAAGHRRCHWTQSAFQPYSSQSQKPFSPSTTPSCSPSPRLLIPTTIRPWNAADRQDPFKITTVAKTGESLSGSISANFGNCSRCRHHSCTRRRPSLLSTRLASPVCPPGTPGRAGALGGSITLDPTRRRRGHGLIKFSNPFMLTRPCRLIRAIQIDSTVLLLFLTVYKQFEVYFLVYYDFGHSCNLIAYFNDMLNFSTLLIISFYFLIIY